MTHFSKVRTLAVASSLAAALTACGSDSTNKTGSLYLGVTDGPVELADSVVISFTSVELHGAENTVITFDEPKTINLLDYQGENRLMLLDNETLLAGEYQWIRLGVQDADSYIEIDGIRHSLVIPSGAESGLKMNRGITIGAGTTTDFTIEFVLPKSVHQEGTDDFKLRPTLRLVDNLEVNSITGTVGSGLITNINCHNGDNDDMGNSIYLFTGTNTPIQDIQGNEGDPLTTASVNYNDVTELYEFTIGYVPVGEYTLSFTCDATLDNGLEDNSAEMVFTTGVNVSVSLEEGEPIMIE